MVDWQTRIVLGAATKAGGMGLGGIFRAWKTQRRYARLDRDWNRSVRKRELDAECNLAPRPLTEEEDKLLRWILEHGSEEARSFLPQVEGIRAVRSCTCGCPTIELRGADDSPSGDAHADRILCDLIGNTALKQLVGVMLFQGGGKLSCLEVYSLDGEAGPPEFGLPTTESMRDFHEGDSAEN